MAAQDFTLYDTLVRSAEARGDALAVIDETGNRRSYREMLSGVDALAQGLQADGIGHGDRIAVLASNSGAFLDLYFAAARIGAVLYPFNWRLSSDEIDRLLGRAAPRAIVVDAAFMALLPESAKAIDFCYQVDDAIVDGFTPLAALYDSAAPATPATAAANDPLAIIATAAVEAIPRGSVLTHANILAANLQTVAAMGVDETCVHLAALPLFHIAGLGNALSTVHAGGTNVIMAKFDATEARRMIDEYGVTLMFDFPPILSSVLDAAKQAGSNLPTLETVCGLDAPDTIERLHTATNASFWTGFGQTETTGFITIQRFSERPGSAGRPAHLSRLKLVDEYDREVDIGDEGEILVRGATVHQGYDGEPEVTAHSFRGGWHHTGDIGRLDAEGYLYYVRRSPEKELIKPGGENVYPAEVEAVIMELEKVTGVCVYGVPDTQWGEAIMAVVEAEDGMTTGDDIIDHVASRIARFKKPKYVEFAQTLPRTEAGAVDREAVKAQWGGNAQ